MAYEGTSDYSNNMEGEEALRLHEKEPNGWSNSREDAPFVAIRDLDIADEDDSERSTHKVEERHQWGHKAEYILSLLGYCVGLGNIWRFPYICIRNGGGAFLIPFFLCLFIMGLPLYFLENAMGQFVAKSTFHVWVIAPLFKGVGISMVTLNSISSWYYVMVLSWTLIFLFNSFRSPLPWTLCGQYWNTESCVPPEGRAVSPNSTSLYGNVTGQGRLLNFTGLAGNWTVGDTMGNSTAANVTVKSASEEFWINNVLELSPGLEHIDGMNWKSSLALFVASLIVFACIWKGVRSVGKVVYLTATLPYILILVLLIKGATLPGAVDGITFYLKPDFSKLLKITTWIEACMQVFYSLGPCWGNLLTVASYNKFKSNCMLDSIILSLVCEGTSIFAGVATFSFLGHMSHTLNIPVGNFSSSGPGLAFVVFPEAISYLPLPQLWGVLFFTMLFTLGLDSQFVCVETVFTFISDMWPQFMRRYNLVMKGLVCLLLFIFGLAFCTRGGMYVFQLVDWYLGSFTVLVCGILECVVVAWIYGADRFCRDVELMIGRKPLSIFPFLWQFVSPWLLLTATIFTLIFYEAPVYEGYTYGPGGVALGWFIGIVSFVPIPAWMVYTLLTEKGTFLERVKTSCTATDEWVPSDPSLVDQYLLDKKAQGDTPCRCIMPCGRFQPCHGSRTDELEFA